ncbi:MAG: hypothetical protein H6834_16610 [Planctomycetes bacterium]|nr:hypothetical protein [Planctomycetota bacterium]
MDAHENIIHLKRRLEAMQRQPVAEWERSIHEVALRTVEDRIVELGRLLRNRQVYRTPGHSPGDDLTAA